MYLKYYVYNILKVNPFTKNKNKLKIKDKKV